MMMMIKSNKLIVQFMDVEFQLLSKVNDVRETCGTFILQSDIHSEQMIRKHTLLYDPHHSLRIQNKCITVFDTMQVRYT